MIPEDSSFLKKVPKPGGTQSVDEKIDKALLSLVYSEALISSITNLFIATLILISLRGTGNNALLVAWYGIFIGVILYRSIIASIYNARINQTRSIRLWRNLFIVGAFLSGLMWGMMGSVLFPINHIKEQLPVVLVLAGMSAGSLPILSGSLTAMLLFIIALVLPVMISLLFRDAYLMFDVMLFYYLVYLVIVAFKMHKTIRGSLAIQFQNTELLDHLSAAKHELEVINKKLEQVATHDPLTNIPNRNLFNQYFEDALVHAKLNRKILALLFIDIDGFKEINDTYGHHIGDQLLLVLVDRLDQIVDNPNAIGRLGGDEFTILLDDVVDPHEVAKIAGRICNAIAEPTLIDHLEIKVSASIGIAIYPLDGDNVKSLIAVADKAMYHVKEHGGNGFRFNVTLTAD